jgi:hypothetical protein
MEKYNSSLLSASMHMWTTSIKHTYFWLYLGTSTQLTNILLHATVWKYTIKSSHWLFQLTAKNLSMLSTAISVIADKVWPEISSIKYELLIWYSTLWVCGCGVCGLLSRSLSRSLDLSLSLSRSLVRDRGLAGSGGDLTRFRLLRVAPRDRLRDLLWLEREPWGDELPPPPPYSSLNPLCRHLNH